jgi:cell wall hydrolase
MLAALVVCAHAGKSAAQQIDAAATVLRMWPGLGGGPQASAVPSPLATPPPPAPAAASPDDGGAPMPLHFADLAIEGGGEDRQRSINCLAAAIHYEAANQSLAGRQAVAEVVLNRVRRPGYPKTVCGVVFQGWRRATGCQFTFTCDGSLRRRPSAASWRKALAVAEQVLAGAAPRSVGGATNYHADYVRPYWSPSLVRIAQIGAHIFYRPHGPDGPAPGLNLALARTVPTLDVSPVRSHPQFLPWGLMTLPSSGD